MESPSLCHKNGHLQVDVLTVKKLRLFILSSTDKHCVYLESLCYDKILMSVASLSGRKYGVHKKIIYVHAATLEEAEYKLKLSLKTSSTSYRHCKKFSFHGTVQG